MHKHSMPKPNIFLRLAGLLLILVMFTVCIMPDLYARYTALDAGFDGARVAHFDVNTTFNGEQQFEVALQPGKSQTFLVRVYNTSEVALQCVIIAENKTRNLPLRITVTDLARELTYPNLMIATYPPPENGEAHYYYVTVEWPDDLSDDLSGDLSDDYMYQGQVDIINLIVRCTQWDGTME